MLRAERVHRPSAVRNTMILVNAAPANERDQEIDVRPTNGQDPGNSTHPGHAREKSKVLPFFNVDVRGLIDLFVYRQAASILLKYYSNCRT